VRDYLLAEDGIGNPLRIDRRSALGLAIAKLVDTIKDRVAQGRWAAARGYLVQLYRTAFYYTRASGQKLVAVEEKLVESSQHRSDMRAKMLIENTNIEEEVINEIKHMTQTQLELRIDRIAAQVEAYLRLAPTSKIRIEFVKTRGDQISWSTGRILSELKAIQPTIDVSRVNIEVLEHVAVWPSYIWRATLPGS
jgi:hypothetical protein